MLRLLRRIRETTDDELPPGVAGLTPEDLSVIYVESADEGVRFRSLHVDAEGEFLDRWPRGFFEERAGELFLMLHEYAVEPRGHRFGLADLPLLG